MNDETEKLKRQLEAATAPGDLPDGTLDPETESLRQGWLALGRLLEDAEARRPGAAGGWRMPVERRPRRRRLVALAAVVASLLVAAAVAWALRGKGPADAPLPLPEQIAEDKNTPAAEQPDGTHVVKQQPAPATELSWNGPLDEQIVSAGQSVLRIQQQWCWQEGSFDYLRYGLNQIEEEFDDDSL